MTRALVATLIALMLVALILAFVGAVPVSSAVSWLILVGLLVVALVLFDAERHSSGIKPTKHRH